GRVRREDSPDQVMIWDPVANTSYQLDPKAQTVRKLPLGMNAKYSVVAGDASGGQTFTFRVDPGQRPPLPGPVTIQALPLGGLPPLPITAAGGKATPKSEVLGQQMIEGISAQGTRLTSTLAA